MLESKQVIVSLASTRRIPILGAAEDSNIAAGTIWVVGLYYVPYFSPLFTLSMPSCPWPEPINSSALASCGFPLDAIGVDLTRVFKLMVEKHLIPADVFTNALVSTFDTCASTRNSSTVFQQAELHLVMSNRIV